MKVNIGNYTNRLYSESDILQWIYNHTINLYLDRREQKIKVKIDPWDTWSMDHTLAHIVVPMLVQLKESKHGAPLVDDKDVPAELRSTNAPPKENPWDTDANHFKRWDWVMDEMIHAFQSKLDDDYMWRPTDKQYKRIKNGFRLFGKYYEALWD